MATFNGTSRKDKIYGTGTDDTINGLGDDDTLYGLDGNDTIDGGIGADKMYGGIGNDRYYVDNLLDQVIELKSEGKDGVVTTITYTLPDNVEDLTLQAGAGAIKGTGNALDNSIYGNASKNTLSGLEGDDTLDGGGDADRMIGGKGDDYYVVDHAGDVVVENLKEGIDEVRAWISYTLPADVENLTVSAGNGTGNSLDNVIKDRDSAHANVLSGLDGNDTLESYYSGGTDTLIGGKGNDIYVLGTAFNGVVTENLNEGIDLVQSRSSYTLLSNFENLDLVGTGNLDGTGNGLDNIIHGNYAANTLSGNGGADHLYGLESADVLVGGPGDDTLDGGTGADIMTGGTENDAYYVDDPGDSVTEAANAGTDWVNSSITWTLGANFENLALLGMDAIDGTGNGLDNFIAGNRNDNVLTGGDGNDTFDAWDGNDTVYGQDGDDHIDGGPGDDTMVGGIGNDTYYILNTTDVDTMTENVGEGIDTVESWVSYTLPANVENLILLRVGDLNGTGNGLDNTIIGNEHVNTLDGGNGNDTLDGGDDNDTLLGGRHNDMLIGGQGDDVLDGGRENDTLIGGMGTDLLTGGPGMDTFRFDAPNEGADGIFDFTSGVDTVAIEHTGFGIAGTGTLAANGVAFVAGTAATSADATLLFDAATHRLMWDADGTGAGSTQLLGTMFGVSGMQASDFVIV